MGVKDFHPPFPTRKHTNTHNAQPGIVSTTFGSTGTVDGAVVFVDFDDKSISIRAAQQTLAKPDPRNVSLFAVVKVSLLSVHQWGV